MNELSIPTLIRSGSNSKFLRISFLIMLFFALLLHLGIFVTLGYLGKHPFIFLFPDKSKIILDDKPLNFVLVDDNLVDEEIKDEKPKALGKTSRQSRDTVVDPTLPKLGPSSSEESTVTSFDNGIPLPESIAAPEITPTPPAIPEIKPQEAIKPTKPANPIIKTEPIKPVLQPKEKVVPDLPELDIEDETIALLPKIKRPDSIKEVEKADKFDELQVPGINSSDEISKLKEEPIKNPEITPKHQAQPVTTAQTPVKPQQRIPTRKIPVRKIGSKNSSSGGKIQKRLNSSAINAGSKSIAVLRSRYGAYMDKILRRIQQAIIIQQQINPIGIHEGNVVMSFTINPSGILDQIKYINSAPQGITSEVSAARSVLLDVQNSGPFEPPTQQMLNDPDFKDIIINFVFANR